MGKAKKVRITGGDPRPIKVSLGDEIESSKTIKGKTRNKVRIRNDGDQEYIEAKKILPLLNRQRMEIEEEEKAEDGYQRPSKHINKPTKLDSDHSEDEDIESDNEVTGNEYYEDVELNEEDERAIEMFMAHGRAPTRTLADIIMEKLTEKKTEIETQFSDAGAMQISEIDPKVREMFEGVRDVLSRYRSGKLPKAFKLVPSLTNWEQILYITDPSKWSAAAMYGATRIFSSNLKEKMAQRFYNLVLLPRIRDDLAEYKRLNFHLYQALRRSLYKPGAFMKGILLPLLESGTCSLREAVIVGSVVAKNSIPILHSSAALLKIAEMPYTGANSIFLRILLDKRYALPYRVVDGLVFHFIKFQRETRELPVLWHQALLTFVQRYKGHISSEQKEALLELLRSQSHHTITPEIRRELQHAKCRDEEIAEPMAEESSVSHE